MRYQPNDLLVHAHHGVGRVLKLEVRQFGDEAPQEYYQIGLATGTIWVPLAGPVNGLRRLTAKEDLPRYRGLLRGRPVPLHPDRKERKLELIKRMRATSFRARCETVRDLGALGWEKPLNETTATAFREARQVLCAEWAAAAGATFEAAASEVDALLLLGKNTYRKELAGAGPVPPRSDARR